MSSTSAASLARRIDVAAGRAAGDLLLTGGRVVNVFNGSIEPADVVIADGMIAGVGAGPWTAAERVDVSGMFVAPGLIDAHMHVESTLLMPAALAAVIVPHGTAAIIADPHEIGNVLGVAGIELMLAASRGLPLDCFYMAPSCVPASAFERAGAELDAEAIMQLLEHDGILGLAEMMNFPGVLGADPGVVAKLVATAERGRAIDGHAPGLLGRDLVTYAAAGIRSDHECTTVAEALERAALGMLVQVREGSMARNLDTFLPLMRDGRLGDWCLCTDDIHPEDLVADGHIDGLVRRVVAGGVPPAVALRHAALVPARHYGFRDRGAVTPSYRADIAVFADLAAFDARLVVHGGRIVARDGALTESPPSETSTHPNTIHVGAPAPDAFDPARLRSDRPVIGIVPDQIVTTVETPVADPASYAFDPAEDLALIACVQRHDGSGATGLGFVRGFGLTQRGALASSVGHDAHNVLVAGTHPEELRAAVAALADLGGGFVAVANGRVTGTMALPVAGLMSTGAVEQVCAEQAAVNEAARALGCPLHAPFGTLSFLGLTVIPTLRMTDAGLFDGAAFSLVD